MHFSLQLQNASALWSTEYGVKTPQVQPLFPRCLGSSPAPASWLPRNRFPDSTGWSAGVTVPLSLQLPIGVKLRSGGRKSSRLCFLFTFPFIFFFILLYLSSSFVPHLASTSVFFFFFIFSPILLSCVTRRNCRPHPSIYLYIRPSTTGRFKAFGFGLSTRICFLSSF